MEKRKEYDFSGNLIFKGEYLKGKRWNGKGYYLKNNIVFNLKEGKGIAKTLWLDDDNYGLIIYEGEYLNGEKNGKGIEYEHGILKFEGEYLKGKRNGKGKEYYNSGKLKFEGELLKGDKWKGRGYDENGNILYELVNGNGIITEYDLDGELEFIGELIKIVKKMEKQKNINLAL